MQLKSIYNQNKRYREKPQPNNRHFESNKKDFFSVAVQGKITSL